MIVAQNTFFLILGIIAFVIFLKPLYMHFIKKQKQRGNIYDAIRLVLFLALLPVNWYTPKIVTVSDCKDYKEEVVLFPTNKNGIEISYGKKTYIFNNSAKNLIFEYHYYGNNSPAEGEENEVIKPKHSVKVNAIYIDYFFETPEESISSKSGGATKTSLRCE